MENSAPELSGPVEYQAEYGRLESVLLDNDPLDMAVLVEMGRSSKIRSGTMAEMQIRLHIILSPIREEGQRASKRHITISGRRVSRNAEQVADDQNIQC